MPVALITGASRGLGRALASSLAKDQWDLVVDARDATALHTCREELLAVGAGSVAAVPGSVADDEHRRALAAEAQRLGGLDLLVNNASRLGPSPQPRLSEYPLDEWERVFSVDVAAPLALTQLVLAGLCDHRGTLVNISSDAAVEAYEGWGGYGSAKAAFDHWTAVLGVEEPALSIYSFDPGDMRTQMQQEAFPGEDISDRPEPDTVVPALRALLTERPSSGRYRASDLAADRIGATA